VSASGSTFLLHEDIILGYYASNSGSTSGTKPLITPPKPTAFRPTPAPAEPTSVPVQPTSAPGEPTSAPGKTISVPIQPTTAPVKPTSGKVPGNSSNNESDTTSDLPKDTLNQDHTIGLSIKSMLEKKMTYVREQVHKADNKWIVRTINDPEVDLGRGEICFKVSLKYVDNDWTSLRANSYMYFDILIDDSGNKIGVRFKSIKGTNILNPKNNIESQVSEFEQKAGKALEGQYFWPDGTAPASFKTLIEKS